MSCQAIQNRANYDVQSMNCPTYSQNITAYSSSPDSLASFDYAFGESEQMAMFQNKMRQDNPIYSPTDNIPPHAPFGNEAIKMETAAINRDMKKMMGEHFQQSSETQYELNKNPMVGSIAVNEKKYPASVCNTNVQFPLTRMQHYNAQKLGTNLLEGFDPLTGLEYNVKETTGMSLFKLILLIILIGALIYGAYYLCNSEENYTGIAPSDSRMFGNPQGSTMSDEIKKLLHGI